MLNLRRVIDRMASWDWINIAALVGLLVWMFGAMAGWWSA